MPYPASNLSDHAADFQTFSLSRLMNNETPGFVGLLIDVYGQHLHIIAYESQG